jgi:hypothetical protein
MSFELVLTIAAAPAPLKYVNKVLHDDPDMPKFMGKPRPEMDQAWHELLDATMIRFSKEELLLAGNTTSVRHKSGGYIGGLGVSHSLHCIVSLPSTHNPVYPSLLVTNS